MRVAPTQPSQFGGHAAQLAAKFKNRTAVVGVVGLGYVGLPFAVEKARVGFHVRGIDQNPSRVQAVMQGQSYIKDVDTVELTHWVNEGLITAATDFDAIPKMDVIVICVPTP